MRWWRRMTGKPLPIGTPALPAAVELGADVLYIGCGHEHQCIEELRPCSIPMYGPMELMQVRKDGLLVCRPEDVDDPRHWPMFGPQEVSTPDAVAKHAAARLDAAA